MRRVEAVASRVTRRTVTRLSDGIFMELDEPGPRISLGMAFPR
jgi:hypothetical protein